MKGVKSEVAIEATSMPKLIQNSEQNIGKMLLDSGQLKPQDAERVLEVQKQQGLRFGEAALKLKLISREDLEQALASQFSYPYLRNNEGDFSKELIAAYKPFSPKVEAMRAIRSQLMLRWFSSERRGLAIVSPGKGEGRSYAAANLAVVFSQLGERTLLIDADLRRPRQHSIFNINSNTGLSTVLAGRGDSNGVTQLPAFQNLSILPAGASPPNPQELLSQSKFEALLEELYQDYEVILIDTPAGNISSDAEIISARVCGALMLGRKGKTRIADNKRLADQLDAVGTELVGTVLNSF